MSSSCRLTHYNRHVDLALNFSKVQFPVLVLKLVEKISLKSHDFLGNSSQEAGSASFSIHLMQSVLTYKFMLWEMKTLYIHIRFVSIPYSQISPFRISVTIQ